MAYTVTDALQELHVLLVKDTDYPDSSEEDYQVRLALLKNAVRVWASEEGVLWNELFTTLADSATGGKTIVLAQTEYAAPDDFAFPVGYLRVLTNGSSTYYRLIGTSDVQLFDNNTGDYFYYVTGNGSAGRVIHLHPSPTSSIAGSTINYEYYKTPTIPAVGADVLEMSDPQFAVYWALAELIKDEDPGLAGEYTQIAINKLAAMRLRNDQTAHWQRLVLADEQSGFGY